MWYNLSHNAGNPFKDYVRQFGTHTLGCPFLRQFTILQAGHPHIALMRIQWRGGRGWLTVR